MCVYFVQETAKAERDRMKKMFEKIPYFCATSDIWSRSNKSFIAVSVHYFESKSLELKSKFIACEYFPGRHTHDKVAEKLSSIFERYGISKKVFFVTTDGAGEYVAAFKYFGDNYRSIHLHDADEEDLGWLTDGPAASIASSSTSAQMDHADVSSVLQSNLAGNERDSDLDLESGSDSDSFSDCDDSDSFVHTGKENESVPDKSDSFFIHELPLLLHIANRIDCGAHKVDKMGGIDALNALEDENYANIYNRVFAKLEAIWRLKDSRLNAEIFHRITGRKLIGPHRIRWLKEFESVRCFFSLIKVNLTFNDFLQLRFVSFQVDNILAIEQTKLTSACSRLGVSPLDDDEYSFLQEYHKVMKLIAMALKSIESDSYTFALYLPTLFGLRINLQAMIDGEKLLYCEPLVVALQSGLNARFGNLMDPFGTDAKSVPLFVAMLSNPKFKLNFMGMKQIQPDLLNRLKEMLLSEAIKIENSNGSDNGHAGTTDTHTQSQTQTQIHTRTQTDTHKKEKNKLLIENDVCIGDPWDQNTRIKREIDRYLCTKASVTVEDGLNDFDIIRKLFLKFNCIRASEAICERLFSYAGELRICIFVCYNCVLCNVFRNLNFVFVHSMSIFYVFHRVFFGFGILGQVWGFGVLD